MDTSSNLGSAKIYQFPVGGRSAVANRRDAASGREAPQLAIVADVACGGSWYHEEAVQAERERKQ